MSTTPTSTSTPTLNSNDFFSDVNLQSLLSEYYSSTHTRFYYKEDKKCKGECKGECECNCDKDEDAIEDEDICEDDEDDDSLPPLVDIPPPVSIKRQITKDYDSNFSLKEEKDTYKMDVVDEEEDSEEYNKYVLTTQIEAEIDNVCDKLLLNFYDKIMVLKIFVNREDQTLVNIYDSAIEKHNSKILNSDFPDAGFDLFCPESANFDFLSSEVDIDPQTGKSILNLGTQQKLCINLQVQCSATVYTENYKKYNTGFYLYPRSSISKSSLRLANSVGIIDSGYRNNVLAVFDCKDTSYQYEKYSRLVQICAPSLMPIYVIRVYSLEDLGDTTERNLGGFGSTGV